MGPFYAFSSDVLLTPLLLLWRYPLLHPSQHDFHRQYHFSFAALIVLLFAHAAKHPQKSMTIGKVRERGCGRIEPYAGKWSRERNILPRDSREKPVPIV